MIIAIDGLSGTGKSSCAAALEAELPGFAHMNTGNMFRAVALGTLEAGADLGDQQAVESVLGSIEIGIEGEHTLLNGRDVSALIRSSAVDAASSKTAVYPAVRAHVLKCERTTGSRGDWIVDGRDIGTVVFPDADVKFFLMASADEKARRRAEQNKVSGCGETDIAVLTAQMKERDIRDAERAEAPCIAASDAIVIDTDGLDLDGVVSVMLGHLKKIGIG